MIADSCSRKQNKFSTYSIIISDIDVITFSCAINRSSVCKRNAFTKMNWHRTKNTFTFILQNCYACFQF